eukprot:c11335_g1_i1.p1 GENE.c11335_g1_i1~~c11335_g1_i1.p1  ORF type:complete len:594 (+),score=145.18 c11335_g1_i1:244-2025(+)
MEEGESAVRVGVRVRPFLAGETGDNIVHVINNKTVELLSESSSSDDSTPATVKSHVYSFDFVFDTDSSQQEVYDALGAPIVPVVIGGVNATMFAYGATGSGKTFTMLGVHDNRGLMHRTICGIFDGVKQRSFLEFRIQLTYVEVYNELVRDLLNPMSRDTLSLEIRETVHEGTHVVGAITFDVQSPEHLFQIMQEGDTRRSTETTDANATSSRSHAILTISVTTRNDDGERKGKLLLIDLAGSEKAKHTNATGQRLVEGSNINKSLLALGNCISALGGKGRKGGFVNFRDSKLTRLLKESLGGNCKTSMIAAISPSHVMHDETLGTLKYANRAKNIKTQIQVNYSGGSNEKIIQYKRTIDELRSTISSLQDRLLAVRMEKAGISNMSLAISSVSQLTFTEVQENFLESVRSNFSERRKLRQQLNKISEQMRTLAVQEAFNSEHMRAFDQLLQSGAPNAPSPEDIEKLQATMLEVQSKLRSQHEKGIELNETLKRNEEVAAQLEAQIVTQDSREFSHFLEMIMCCIGIEREVMELELQTQIRDKVIEDLFSLIHQKGVSRLLPEHTRALLRAQSIMPDSDALANLAIVAQEDIA